jgi:quercetin dioxygenase-like cupin family protein
VTDPWFVKNVRDLPWMHNDAAGVCCVFEDDEHEFGQIGYTLAVLQPGQSGRYHKELDNQEDFLVLSGECLAIVEGEEHRLTQWDFVHCPPGTAHVIIGAGDGPCVVLMTGARQSRRYVYLRNELALRHGAGPEADTTESSEGWAGLPKWGPGVPLDL